MHQDGTGGLQLFDDESKKWLDIPPLPVGENSGYPDGVDRRVENGVADGFLVNCGDYLSMLTNGTFISPIHRVVGPSEGSDRLSFTFFCYPSK